MSEFSWNGNPITWLKARDYYDQGRLYQHRYQLPAAEAKFKKTIAIYPNDWRFNYVLAQTYLLSGNKYDEAERLLDTAHLLERKNATVCYALSMACYKQQKFEKAAKTAKEAMELDPENAAYPAQLAIILLSEGKVVTMQKKYSRLRNRCERTARYSGFCLAIIMQ